MTDIMLATVLADDPTRLRWCEADAAPRTGSYAEFASAVGARESIVLLDATQVTLLAVELPVSDLRTARQAAPFAIEEQLAQPLDSLHFALAPVGGGRYALAALDRALREQVIEALRSSGLKPRLVAAEQCALPCAPHTWTIVIDGEQVLLRVAHGAAFKTTLADLAQLVPLLRQQFPDTERVTVHASGRPPAFPLSAFHGLALLWQAPLRDAQRVAQLEQEVALALIDASADTELKAKSRRWWQVAAAVVAFAVLALPALLAWRHATLEQVERRLSARNDTLFRATFPTIQRIVNPRVQADQAVAALREGASSTPRLLDLLARVDTVRTSGLPAATRLTQAAFASGALELGVEVAGMDAVESLRSALHDAGLSADTLSAEAADGKVVARLRVQVGS